MLTGRGRALLHRRIYVLVKVADAFVVPYTPPRWEAVASDPSYGAEFVPFLERFLVVLEAGDWAPGSYYPGGWYRALVAQGQALDRVTIMPDVLGPFWLEELRVDRAGRWFAGQKPITGRVLRFFLGNLDYDTELGRYAVRYRMRPYMDVRYLHHESPPIRVQRVTPQQGQIVLQLNTGRSEPLQPETLRMDADGQLYCAVGPERLPAWFEEPARWEVLKDAKERGGEWVLSVAGQELAAPLEAPWPYADGLPA